MKKLVEQAKLCYEQDLDKGDAKTWQPTLTKPKTHQQSHQHHSPGKK